MRCFFMEVTIFIENCPDLREWFAWPCHSVVVPCHVIHCQSTIHRIVLLRTLQGTILFTRCSCVAHEFHCRRLHRNVPQFQFKGRAMPDQLETTWTLHLHFLVAVPQRQRKRGRRSESVIKRALRSTWMCGRNRCATF